MKRLLLLTAAAFWLTLISAPSASAFGVKDVVQMHNDGIADSLVVQKIAFSGKTFRLGANDLRALKAAGVSDEVISAMLRTEDQGEDQDSYYDGGYYPRRHVVVGLGFNFGYPGYYGYYHPYAPYYGSYWGHRYSPYYGRSHSGYYGRGGSPRYSPNTRYRGSVGAPSAGRSAPHGAAGVHTRQR
jgi:hypothetical protein